MKPTLITIALLFSILPIQSAIAEPNSCKASAITLKEKEAVDILQEMYLVQFDLEDAQNTLDKLNEQMSEPINRRNTEDVEEHNNLVNEYNQFVQYSNQTGEYYNGLKDSFNGLINYISPSTNVSFINCLNVQSLTIRTNTNSLNLKTLDLQTDNLRNTLNRSREYLEN